MESIELPEFPAFNAFGDAGMHGQQPLLFLGPDALLKDEGSGLSDIVNEADTGIEKEVKCAPDDIEQEEYARECGYEAENSYAQNSAYAPERNYERVEELKAAEDEEEKAFLWK